MQHFKKLCPHNIVSWFLVLSKEGSQTILRSVAVSMKGESKMNGGPFCGHSAVTFVCVTKCPMKNEYMKAKELRLFPS